MEEKLKNPNVADFSDLYYKPDKLLSYNRILNFLVGARGTGKTYSLKCHVVRRFKKHGELFGYIRRYKEELKGLETWFEAIQQEFPDDEFKVKNRTFYINGKICGYAFQLSKWQSYKSKEFPHINTLLFDEFIREKDNSGYIPNDVEGLLNLMDTIFRTRDNTRCICMSNAVSVVNPYFIYFGLVPDINRRFNAYESIVVEIPTSRDFSEQRRKTRFGKLIDGTNYGGMSLDNEFTGDNYTFVERRNKESKFICTIVYQGFNIGVWSDGELMYMSQDYDPSSKFTYALSKNDMTERTLLTNHRNNFYLNKIVRAFKKGLLRFDNQVMRTTCYEMFKRMNVQ